MSCLITTSKVLWINTKLKIMVMYGYYLIIWFLSYHCLPPPLSSSPTQLLCGSNLLLEQTLWFIMIHYAQISSRQPGIRCWLEVGLMRPVWSFNHWNRSYHLDTLLISINGCKVTLDHREPVSKNKINPSPFEIPTVISMKYCSQE